MTNHYSCHGSSSLCQKFQHICISEMENRAAIQSDISTVVSCMKGRMLYSAYGIIQNNDTVSAKSGEQNPMIFFF